KEDYPREITLYRQLVAGEIPFYRIEKRYVRKNGTIIWAEILRSIVRDSNGAPLYTIGALRDITEEKKAEAALQKAKELLEHRVRERTHQLLVANKELKGEIERRKGLEGEILAISDREQQRLGQELHDGLCQHLTAVAFMARSVALRLKNHRVIDANKHAQAREIVVKLERSPQGMVLRVTDDGVGFPDEPKLKHGLGAHIMNYRAQLAGGRLEIGSSRQGGTCVSCYLPHKKGV